MNKHSVEVPPPPASLQKAARILSWIPRSIRIWLMLQKVKPVEANRPKDIYEVLGQDPYTIEEVEPGKLWMVTYTTEDMFFVSGAVLQDLKMFFDVTSEEGIKSLKESAEAFGMSEQAEADIKKWEEVRKMSPEEGKAGGYAKAGTTVFSMFVVKLKEGELLLYSPITVHDNSTLSKLLDDLGEVKWIVFGTAAHSFYLPSVLKRYPDAKLVGSSHMSAKLNSVSALPRGKIDYEVNHENLEALKEANQQLKGHGVSLHFIEGDMATDSIWLFTGSSLLEADLLYMHRMDCTCDNCDLKSETWTDPKYWNRRLLAFCFKSSAVAHPDYGLPFYRFWFMDPQFSSLTYNGVPADGSASRRMAASLRTVLGLPFQRLGSLHSPVMMPADASRANMDALWSWLDGEKLV